jgi:hypothetical protein
MKHTTEELLFALQLRELVMQRLTNDAPENSTLEEFRQWRKVNQARYMKDAITEMEEIAEIIRTVRAEK